MKRQKKIWLVVPVVLVLMWGINAYPQEEIERAKAPFKPYFEPPRLYVAPTADIIPSLDLSLAAGSSLGANALSYKAIEFPDGNSQAGTYKIQSYDKSRDYSVNWEMLSNEASDGTAPWLSKDVFRELKKNGFTAVNINKQLRKDAIVMAELKGMTKFPVILNGKEVKLDAIQLNTDKGDKLIILDEMQNPLVLSAEVTGLYTAKVTNIYIPGYK